MRVESRLPRRIAEEVEPDYCAACDAPYTDGGPDEDFCAKCRKKFTPEQRKAISQMMAHNAGAHKGNTVSSASCPDCKRGKR